MIEVDVLLSISSQPARCQHPGYVHGESVSSLRRRPSIHLRYRRPLVASRTALGFSELVHLGDSLLELDVLALLVGVSLVLWGKSTGQLVGLPRSEVGGGAVSRTSHFHGR